MLHSKTPRSSMSLRALALGTTCIVSSITSPVFAQQTLDWNAGDDGSGTPIGGDGTWERNDGQDIWLDGAGNPANFDDGDSVVFGPGVDPDGPMGPAEPEGYDVTLTALGGSRNFTTVENITITTDDVSIIDNGPERLTVTGVINVVDEDHTASVNTDFFTGLVSTGDGTLELLDSVLNGDLVNNGNGTVVVRSVVGRVSAGAPDGTEIGGLVSNNGVTEVTATGSVEGDTTIETSTVRVNGGDLKGETFVNELGILDVNSGSVGAVTNGDGTIQFDGGRIESIVQNDGTADINGVVSGDVTFSGGDFNLLGDGVVGGTFNNEATFTFSAGVLNDVNNTGIFAINNGQAVEGSFSNGNGMVGALDARGTTADATLIVRGGDGFTTAGDIVVNELNNLTITTTNGVITLNEGSNFVVVDAGGTEVSRDTSWTSQFILNGDIVNDTTSGISGDYTLRGTLTNNDIFEVGAELNTDGNQIINTGAGTMFTVGAGGSIVGDGALDNNTGAAFTINEDQSATFSGVTNGGAGAALNVNGELNSGSSIQNNDDATLTVGGSGLVNAGVSNNGNGTVALVGGQIDASGGSGTVVNGSNGTVTSSGNSTIVGTLRNANDVNVTAGTLEVSQTVENEDGGEINISDDATLAASVENQNGGFVVLGGTVDGVINNLVGGTVNTTTSEARAADGVNNAGALIVGNLNIFTSDVTNAGTGIVTMDGTLRGNLTNNGGQINATTDGVNGEIDGFLNSINGSVVVGADSTLTVSGLTTITNGSFQNDGVFTGDITNDGSTDFMMNNDINGTLTTESGTTNVNGTLNGNLVSNGGITEFGANTAQGLGQGIVTINEDSTVRMENNASMNQLVLNGGTLSMRDVNSMNDTTDDVVTVNGDAILNGTLSFNISTPEEGMGDPASDILAVAGNVSGEVTLDFTNLAGAAREAAPFDVITFGGTSDDFRVVGITEASTFSEWDYFAVESAGAIQVESRIASGIPGLASSVGLIQTIGGAVVNRPTSPYVSDLATDFGDQPCGAGGWTRFSSGEATASGDFTDEFSDATGNSPLTLDYQGLQVGGDIACFDDRFGGDDMAFGATVGFNNGSAQNEIRRLGEGGETTDDILSVTTTDFDQTYGGVYLTASSGRLFADVQYRVEQTDYTSSNDGTALDQIPLDNEKFSTTGSTLSGSAGYSWSIPQIENLNFVGSFGFSYSQYETDEINVGDDVLQLDDATQELGFVSGTLARTFVLPDNISFANYFTTATLYQDFASKPTATFTSGGSVTPITLANIENYGELSAGINYVRLLDPAGSALTPRQFNAALRVDGRAGEDFDSWGFTGQMRLQF